MVRDGRICHDPVTYRTRGGVEPAIFTVGNKIDSAVTLAPYSYIFKADGIYYSAREIFRCAAGLRQVSSTFCRYPLSICIRPRRALPLHHAGTVCGWPDNLPGAGTGGHCQVRVLPQHPLRLHHYKPENATGHTLAENPRLHIAYRTGRDGYEYALSTADQLRTECHSGVDVTVNRGH